MCFIFVVSFAVVGSNAGDDRDEADVGTAKAQIKSFQKAIEAYKGNKGRLPEELNDLVDAQNGAHFLAGTMIPKDPWDNEYLYTTRESKYTIISYGADGEPGGDKYDSDISSDDLGERN